MEKSPAPSPAVHCVSNKPSPVKLLTVVVPCYNSAAYMEHAISSLLPGGEELDILLVDDGSTDDTGIIADRFAAAYPQIRVIHQPNGGHGAGLNQGIRTALGMYFKVLDSDDRLDTEGLKALLDLLRQHTAPGHTADLVIHDYTYDKGDKQAVFTVNYASPLPQNKLFSWGECGHFNLTKQLIIHCLIYRTEMLREHSFRLPEHTFYEDNLYSYQPLPWTKNVLYLHRTVHAYNVGRNDQSVNEQNLIKRLDQLTNMVIQMAVCWHKSDLEKLPRQLQQYMINYAAGQIWAVSALHFIADTPESYQLNQDMWSAINRFDPALCRALQRNPIGRMAHAKNPLSRKILIGAYRLGHKILQFG